MSVQADCWCLEPDSIDFDWFLQFNIRSGVHHVSTMFHHNTMPRHNVILVLTDLDPNLGSDQSTGHFLMWLETMAESRVLVMGPLGYRIFSLLSQWKTKEGSLCVALSWSDDLKIREISQTGIQHNPPTAASTDPLSGGPQRHRFGGSVAVFVELRGSSRAAGCPQIATPSLQWSLVGGFNPSEKYLSVGTGWLFTNQISNESVQWNENEWNLGAEFVLVSEQNLAWFSERKFTKMGVYTSITHQAKYW